MKKISISKIVLLLFVVSHITTKGDAMPLIHWKPFHDLERFFDEVHYNNDLAVDVSENDSEVIVKMNIPGIDPDKVEIDVDDRHVHVSGSREEEQEVEDQHYYKKEIRRGSFERMVELPAAVERDKTEAEYENGVLTITFQKKEKMPKVKKKITINKK